MPRVARLVVPGLPHHITQRGNNRQDVFFTDADRRVYLTMLSEQCRRFEVRLTAFCLMTNHVHLVAMPRSELALAKAIGSAHLQYTRYINRLHGRHGHLWQNRFFSCPMEPSHEEAAVRYVERNPVRARMVRLAWRYPWSSAAAHCGEPVNDAMIDPTRWRDRYRPNEWRKILQQPDDELFVERLRRQSFNGRPLASDRWIARLEARLNLRLRPNPVGRPKRSRKAGDVDRGRNR